MMDSTLLRLPQKGLTRLVLLDTLKNGGLAGGLALAFFSKKTSVPATVLVVFMIVHFLWLELKLKKPLDKDERFGRTGQKISAVDVRG